MIGNLLVGQTQLKDEIKDLLRKAKEADKEELPDGMSIPEELARRESRLEAIAAAKAQIEQRAAERFAKEQQEYKKKLSTRKAKEKETGKKLKRIRARRTRICLKPPIGGPRPCPQRGPAL